MKTSPHAANNFDFLRFLLAAAVVFSHCFALCGMGGREPLSRLTGGQAYLAELAVNGFFVLSGFLITASWVRRPQWGDFLAKRALRIYPGFLAASLLCALAVGAAGADGAAAYLHALRPGPLLAHALTLGKLILPTTFAHNPLTDQVNGSLWTIRIEFEFYLLTGVLGALGLFKRRGAVLALAAVCVVAQAAVPLSGSAPHIPATATEHLRFLTYFVGGMAFYFWRDRVSYRPLWLIGAGGLLAFGAWARALDALLPLPLICLLMALAFAPTPRLHRFGRRGDFSYGLYLYAWPIQQLLVQHFAPLHSPWLLFLAALPLTLLAAMLSWHGIEKPCLRLKPGGLKADGIKQEAGGEGLGRVGGGERPGRVTV